MGLALIMPDRDLGTLLENLAESLPGERVQVWPHIDRPEAVDFAVLWRQPPGCLAPLTALRAVTSFGAGADGVLDDPSIDPALPVGRLLDPGLGPQMAAYVLAAILHHALGIEGYRADQRGGRWRPGSRPVRAAVGLLGLGSMSRALTDALVGLGWPVGAWCRTPRNDSGITVHTGREGLERLATVSDHLVCLLPLTAGTRGILDRRLFECMKPGSQLIQVGRGAHLVETDLIDALDRGRPARARLDVFADEPLPERHPFWHHPQIEITPHVAAITSPDAAAKLIARSYRRVMAGGPPLDPVDRQRGY